MSSASVLLLVRDQSAFPQLLWAPRFFTWGKKKGEQLLICITGKLLESRGQSLLILYRSNSALMLASVHSLMRETKKKNYSEFPSPLRIAGLTSCSLSSLVSCKFIRKLKRGFDISLILSSLLMLFCGLNISRLDNLC